MNNDIFEINKNLYKQFDVTPEIEILLNSSPTCCNIWDDKHQNIACNNDFIELLGLSNKQDFFSKFRELSPKHQPDGVLSLQKNQENLILASKKGRIVYEWTFLSFTKEKIPCEITTIKVGYKDSYILILYIKDLRYSLIQEKKESELILKMQTILDSNPLSCNLYDEKYNIIDCNLQSLKLFQINNKAQYLQKAHLLSPENQPDGMNSSQKYLTKLKEAFEHGTIIFEWLNQLLNGERVPVEITFVRLKYGNENIIAAYTRDLRELKNTVAVLQQLENVAYKDPLTGIYNQTCFIDKAIKEFNLFHYSFSPISLLMINIDCLNEINEKYGSSIGDEIVKLICEKIQNVLRKNDILARYGHEYFSLLLLNSDIDNSKLLAHRIKNTVEYSFYVNSGEKIKTTISLGIAIKTSQSQSLDDLTKHAQEALYIAKSTGGNRIEIYE